MPTRDPLDFLISMWLDSMVVAGFTSARWWAQIAMGRPVASGE